MITRSWTNLRRRLAEAEEALRAIQAGEVDAIVVGGATTPTVYTLTSADSPYRLLVEQMREGALTVSGDGVILYCNAAFAQIVQRSSERLRGAALTDFIADPAHKNVRNLFSAERLIRDSRSGCAPAAATCATSMCLRRR